jgi:hypothetical protein
MDLARRGRNRSRGHGEGQRDGDHDGRQSERAARIVPAKSLGQRFPTAGTDMGRCLPEDVGRELSPAMVRGSGSG